MVFGMCLCLKLQAIPKKFSAKKKLPDCVTLKGPGGGTWKVGVATVDNSEFFIHGWPEFVNDHVFGENDLLVFNYNGESLFEVLIFNGQTLCEKEASYFEKRREESKNNLVGSLLKRKLGETSCDNIDTTCSENAGFASPEKSGDDNIIILPTEEQVNTPTTSETGHRKLTAVHLVRNYRNTVVQESPPRNVQMQLVVKNGILLLTFDPFKEHLQVTNSIIS